MPVREPKSLDTWLDTATRGLSETSRESIREEVSREYDESLARARRHHSYERAVEVAMSACLGNPRLARRQYRRDHFTASEAYAILDEDIKEHREAFVIVSGGLVFVVTVVAAAIIQVATFDSSDIKRFVMMSTMAILTATIAALIPLYIALLRTQFSSSGKKPFVHAEFVKQFVHAFDSTPFVITGCLGIMASAIALVVLAMQSALTAPTWGPFGEARAIAVGVGMASLVFALGGIVGARWCARITRIMDNGSK